MSVFARSVESDRVCYRSPVLCGNPKWVPLQNWEVFMWLYWSAFAISMLWTLGVSWAWALNRLPNTAESAIVIVSISLVIIVEFVVICVLAGRNALPRQQPRAGITQRNPAISKATLRARTSCNPAPKKKATSMPKDRWPMPLGQFLLLRESMPLSLFSKATRYGDSGASWRSIRGRGYTSRDCPNRRPAGIEFSARCIDGRHLHFQK